MKKLIFILSAFGATLSHAHELKSFTDIRKSIESGKNIRMVIHFEHCSSANHFSDIHVYTAPVAMMIKNDFIQFANTPLTTNHPQFPQKPVLENVTYKITNQNEVHLTMRVISLPDYSVVQETTAACPLGNAVRVFNK